MKIKLRKKKEKPVTHQQWIEVRRVNGVTVSTFFPANEEFEKERLEMDPEPTLIYRRLNFVHGVPREYLWTNPTPQIKMRGGHFLHRMSVEDWPAVMEDERKMNPRHAVPAARPLPRHEAFGPCPCEHCTQERENQAA
jgi:hypothetical protein